VDDGPKLVVVSRWPGRAACQGWPSTGPRPKSVVLQLLKWRSQQTNANLRRLAEQVVKDCSDVLYDGEMSRRSVYDNLFMTAHLLAV
jgi:hypothetical protein